MTALNEKFFALDNAGVDESSIMNRDFNSDFSLEVPELKSTDFSFDFDHSLFDTPSADMPGVNFPDVAKSQTNWSFMDRLFGGKDGATGNTISGIAGPAMGLAQGAMQTWLGLKQLGLAEDKLSFDKNAFSKQFEAQKTLTNAELESRQKRAADRNVNNKDLYSARVS